MIREKYPPIPSTWPFDGKPPALGWIYALIGYAALVLVFQPYDALTAHGGAGPIWLISAERWFGFCTSILFALSLGIAGVNYIRYRRRLLKRGEPAVSRPWRKRPDVRIILHLFVSLAFAGVAMTLLEICVRSLTPTPALPANDSVWALSFQTLVSVLMGAALIWYDRRRLEKESRTEENRCQTCGYDLRASPTRCPECGAVPAGKSQKGTGSTSRAASPSVRGADLHYLTDSFKGTR